MGQVNRLALSANQTVIKVDGKEVGVIQNARGTEDYAPEALSGVGNIRVQEHVPTLARIGVTGSWMSLRTKSLYSEGIANVTPSDALKGFIFDIEFQDRDTGNMLRRYIGCTFASGEITVNKHSILVTDATFMALDVSGNFTSVVT